MQNRLERGMKSVLKDKGYMFYPNRWSVGESEKEGNLLINLQSYGLASLVWLQENKDIVKKAEKILFMDSMQNVSGQLLSIEENVDYEVYVHLSKYYAGYVENSYYYRYNQHFAKMMGGCDSVGKSYFGDSRVSNYRTVGGIVNEFVPHIKEDFCLWAGYNVDNSTKGWIDFIEIVCTNPSIQFKAFTIPFFETVNYDNLKIMNAVSAIDYIDELRKAKWVLSTSYVESFGYSIFDGISVGALPLACSVGSYKQYLPKRFLYDMYPDFKVECDDNMLKDIIKPFYPEVFCRRLITGAGL